MLKDPVIERNRNNLKEQYMYPKLVSGNSSDIAGNSLIKFTKFKQL